MANAGSAPARENGVAHVRVDAGVDTEHQRAAGLQGADRPIARRHIVKAAAALTSSVTTRPSKPSKPRSRVVITGREKVAGAAGSSRG